MTMQGHSDDWIENRILRSLDKRALPDEQTVLVRDSLLSLPRSMREIAEAGEVGRPVVGFLGGEQLWTLLGTEAIWSNENGRVVHLKLSDIQDVSLVRALQVPQQPCEYISLFDKNKEEHVVWGPPGKGCLGLSGVLQILIRLRPQNEHP